MPYWTASCAKIKVSRPYHPGRTRRSFPEVPRAVPETAWMIASGISRSSPFKPKGVCEISSEALRRGRPCRLSESSFSPCFSCSPDRSCGPSSSRTQLFFAPICRRPKPPCHPVQVVLSCSMSLAIFAKPSGNPSSIRCERTSIIRRSDCRGDRAWRLLDCFRDLALPCHDRSAASPGVV